VHHHLGENRRRSDRLHSLVVDRTGTCRRSVRCGPQRFTRRSSQSPRGRYPNRSRSRCTLYPNGSTPR
jgi:hypothetical protein